VAFGNETHKLNLKTRTINMSIILGIWQADHLAGVLTIACWYLVAPRGSLIGCLGMRQGEHCIESSSSRFLL
jgi:hypothetical protein